MGLHWGSEMKTMRHFESEHLPQIGSTQTLQQHVQKIQDRIGDAWMIHWLLWLTEWVLQGTYRDKNAVRVFGLAGLDCAHEVGQALDVVDAHHVDVIVEAESLDEREVDLKCDVTLVLLIRGEDAERHAVWVTVGKHKGRWSERILHMRVLVLVK